MMDQFKLCRAQYPGYTEYYLQILDEEGYVIGEETIRTETNNIRLNQNFR